MKYLIALLLTACNFGLVDIEDKPKTCYNLDYDFRMDTVIVDSIPYDCGGKKITSPFIHILDPMLK